MYNFLSLEFWNHYIGSRKKCKERGRQNEFLCKDHVKLFKSSFKKKRYELTKLF
ncbi:hypothetical protein HMPREF1547_01704 [Blautia sp. KLE 1732]|nr:hypothetical protein HMPREF1547_01704 [Blautia sp. KLE 1732]